MVDVIEEGFDVMMRTGEPTDSRLMSRPLGTFRLQLVASPAYLNGHGVPGLPTDLSQHACLHYEFSTTGRLERWPLMRAIGAQEVSLPTTMVCNTSAALVDIARAGLGIACRTSWCVWLWQPANF